jgi:hypothetical protein
MPWSAGPSPATVSWSSWMPTVEVHDNRRQHPAARQAADTDLSGRGLKLVSVLADGWGVQDRTPFGKIVWSCFKATGGTTS